MATHIVPREPTSTAHSLGLSIPALSLSRGMTLCRHTEKPTGKRNPNKRKCGQLEINLFFCLYLQETHWDGLLRMQSTRLQVQARKVGAMVFKSRSDGASKPVAGSAHFLLSQGILSLKLPGFSDNFWPFVNLRGKYSRIYCFVTPYIY